jgi:hypothetical protein
MSDDDHDFFNEPDQDPPDAPDPPPVGLLDGYLESRFEAPLELTFMRVAEGRTRAELGAEERRLLDALLREGDLKDEAREAFADMRGAIDAAFGRYPSLTAKQRAWVLSECEERGIDGRDPAERNKAVPRGREVAPAWDQVKLPLSPPGRPPVAAIVRGVEQGFTLPAPLHPGPLPGRVPLVCPDKGRLVMEEVDRVGSVGFKVDMRAFQAAARKAAAGAPFTMQPGSVEPIDVCTLTVEGAALFVEGGKPGALEAARDFRASTVRSVSASARSNRRTVRILDDAGRELASVDHRGMLVLPEGDAPRRRRGR